MVPPSSSRAIVNRGWLMILMLEAWENLMTQKKALKKTWQTG
jgi:hypothetical protein